MTECPKCNGRGTVGYYHIDHFVDIECERCNGSGEVSEVEMTNEEWIKSLDTEQLAKFIFWQHFDVYGKTLYELMVNVSRGVSRDKQAEVMIGAVVEWLKQPHTPKE